MATIKQRGTNKGRQSQSGNSFSTARENPVAAVVAIGSAVAAGVFLWARKGRIKDQIDNLSEQMSDWRGASGTDVGTGGTSAATANLWQEGKGRSQREIAEEALTLKELGTAD